MKFFKHETAVIDENVKVGENTKIWHYSHISINAKIGKNVNIGQNVFIDKGVKIGDGCKIQNNVSVYNGVELKQNVFIGPSVVFTNVKRPRSFIDQKKNFLKTIINKGVTIGANSTIICGINIGKYSFVAANSLVTKSVNPFILVAGAPAKEIEWIDRNANKIHIPINKNGIFECKKTFKKYKIKNGTINCLD